MAKHILVIDDAQELLDAFDELLPEAGYRVSLQAGCPPDCAAVNHARPDLIISDYSDHLPTKETHCWQFVQQLKRDRATAAIPLLLCTTSSTLVQGHGAWLRAHDVQVVAKPFDMDVILTAVARAIGPADADPDDPG